MAIEVLPSLDLPVLFDDHHETFTTHTIPEATGMNRITTVLAAVLSLTFMPLAAQETGCDGWVSSDWDVKKIFWTAATAATVADCLSSGSDVRAINTDEDTPLHNAASLSVDPEVLNVLLNAGADVNARTDPWESQLLIDKIDRFFEGLFPALVDEGAWEDFGNTPLHYAADRNENPEVLTVLLNAGADITARSENGFVPIHQAAGNKNPEVLTALLEAGADVNHRYDDGSSFFGYSFFAGYTPLFFAARHNSPEVLTALLKAGADVNARGEDGGTPLHLAAENNENPDIITNLLNAGADGTAVNSDGETPFDLAKDNEALASTDAYWALSDARFE
jgi:ankyrin repeat protein